MAITREKFKATRSYKRAAQASGLILRVMDNVALSRKPGFYARRLEKPYASEEPFGRQPTRVLSACRGIAGCAMIDVIGGHLCRAAYRSTPRCQKLSTLLRMTLAARRSSTPGGIVPTASPCPMAASRFDA